MITMMAISSFIVAIVINFIIDIIMAFVVLLILIIIREKRLFFMEAVWSRTFPVYKVGEPGHPIIVINAFFLLIFISITW